MKIKRNVALVCLAAGVPGGMVWAQAVGEVSVPREQALSRVVVTATASERDVADAPASVTVIDGDELRRRPVNDLADALRGAVGVDIGSVGLGREGISIRGMNAEHTLVLVDGQRINSSASAIAHSDFELGWVPTEAIERIEVVRGPMSSLYGSEALGGVVNIITRAATDEWQGSASSYALINDHGLDGDAYKSGFYVGGPLVPGTLGFNAWGEYRHRDALQDAENPALTALDDQRATSGHIGLSWTPDDAQRIDVAVDAGNETQEGVRGGTRGLSYASDNDVQRRRYSAAHYGDWAWGDSQVRLYRSTLDRDAWRSDGGDTTSPNRFVDTVLDGQIDFLAGEIHALTLGAEARRESLEDPNINARGKQSQSHYALFGQDEIYFNEQWELVLGSRLDHHDDFGYEVSPRAYVLYRPSDALTLRAGGGRGFKAPTLKQLSPEFESRAAMGGRGIIRGNPDLEPETNQSFELGAAFEQGRWSAGATVFHNDVRNLIETVRQPTCYEPGRVCLAYDNVARARLQGLELTAGVALSEQWQLSANYTYLDAEDRTTGERLADRSRHRANAALAWSPAAPFTTRMEVEYIGTQYRSDSEDDRPEYALWHWYADYDLTANVSLQAGIENLGDERLANDEASVYERADEGRRYFAGVTVRF
ncbi:TonB-dependent receptor domain-containing protein [Halomonas dongshanensis]|uniref:TonB-dependent receptor n=1 Tax=Halomonas dongshanensis TaxID=2890835 RepID=A0ABT2EBS1_9GAMM|nr:TonB-dependent receptor [Halomonas dongshanensis]MCS2608540.1 TonB-dependent receptor [Halomonas dongshanensis]